MAATTARRGIATGSAASAINRGAALMAIAAAGFIGYAVLLLVRNFTDSFLEVASAPPRSAWARTRSSRSAPACTTPSAPCRLRLHRRRRVRRADACRQGHERGTGVGMGTAVATPVLALAVALPAHYRWNLDTLGHLGLIYLAVAVFVAGAALSGKGLLDTKRAGSRP